MFSLGVVAMPLLVLTIGVRLLIGKHSAKLVGFVCLVLFVLSLPFLFKNNGPKITLEASLNNTKPYAEGEVIDISPDDTGRDLNSYREYMKENEDLVKNKNGE